VGLKIADDLPSGKKITCPKCGQGFPVPEGNGRAHASKPAPVPVRKPAQPEEDEQRDPELEEEMRPVVRKRRRLPPEEEEDSEDEIEERRLPRKRRKLKKKKPSRLPLILGLIMGVLVLLVAAGVTFAVIKFWPSDKKADQVAANNPPRSGPPPGMPSGPPRRPQGTDQGSSEAGSERSSPPAAPDSPTPRPSQPTPNPNSSDQFSAGKEVFQRSCARCHRIGESSGGRQGPDLAAIGQRRDADWLMKFVRDPQSLKPNSRMRPQRLNDEDLRAVATYLASLK
jgi:mono/diheme cytochrome c family protein